MGRTVLSSKSMDCSDWGRTIVAAAFFFFFFCCSRGSSNGASASEVGFEGDFLLPLVVLVDSAGEEVLEDLRLI